MFLIDLKSRIRPNMFVWYWINKWADNVKDHYFRLRLLSKQEALHRMPTNWQRNICILDHTQSTFFCLGKFLMWLADDQSSSIKGVSTISNILCTYSFLVWKWIDEKCDIKYVSTMYLSLNCYAFDLFCHKSWLLCRDMLRILIRCCQQVTLLKLLII